jgi:hypothetical protein
MCENEGGQGSLASKIGWQKILPPLDSRHEWTQTAPTVTDTIFIPPGWIGKTEAEGGEMVDDTLKRFGTGEFARRRSAKPVRAVVFVGVTCRANNKLRQRRNQAQQK